MNAIQLLRSMHADTKVAFKIILGTDDPAVADQHWQALQPKLKLHEELEAEFVYLPLQQEFGLGTPLGDWEMQHDADVAVVERLVLDASQLTPGTPEWQMSIATIMDVLAKHVTDEEGQIFGRVEQVWDAARLQQLGAQMEERITTLAQPKASRKSAPARRRR
jgi:hypothetical protein